jgi:hypothetical protein
MKAHRRQRGPVRVEFLVDELDRALTGARST